MNRTTPYALAFATLALVACAKTPEAPAATVTAPTAAPAASGAQNLAAETLSIDAANSSVAFVAAKVTAQEEGRFTDVTGEVRFDPADVTRSTLRLRIGVASLAMENGRLREHLLSGDFLDVARFPEATFRSTALAAGGSGGATHTLTGDLTLHGQTKRVSFPATVAYTGDAVTARAEFSIDRRDFGVVYPGMPDDLIKDEVVLRVNLRAPRMPH